MTIRKCNKCGKILTDKDDYFEIGEINFNKGNNPKPGISVYFSGKNGTDKNYNLNQSWCDYPDLHFCVPCWEKEKLSKYLKEG